MAHQHTDAGLTPAAKKAMQKTSPLLELAAELRNNIYRLVLTSEIPVAIKKSDLRGRTALLQTCRQIRNEASSVFYSENEFRIPLDNENVEHAVAWLKLANTQAKQIKRMSVLVELSPARLAAIWGDPYLLTPATLFDTDMAEKRKASTRGRDDGYMVAQALMEGRHVQSPMSVATSGWMNGFRASGMLKAYFGGVVYELEREGLVVVSKEAEDPLGLSGD